MFLDKALFSDRGLVQSAVLAPMRLKEWHVAGVSFSLCLLAIFISRGSLHAPMTVLANGVAVPAEVGFSVRQARHVSANVQQYRRGAILPC